ncbi:MAG: tetraacyldisaccharide 4'-kinase [Marinomonas foliarum]|uniref:tetraacyldisaccharide 4'-kinase n=1 Tax=Marinomonas foliarum TaxID=491950 RepID=UPI003F9D9454
MNLESLFNQSWYTHYGWTHIFRPLQPLVKKVVANKRRTFIEHPELSYKAPVPVVVVGNISVGGTGKSPMVVALCKLLIENGYRPGIVSRGHGAKLETPTSVYPNSLAKEVGDEPVMLARRAACPMVVFPKRDEAVKYLLNTTDVNIVISDDGMQHYQLNRDIEVAMIDASRGVGNGYLLPVGPLREPIERLNNVDFIVSVSNKTTHSLDILNQTITLAPLIPTKLVSLDGTKSMDYQSAFTPESKWHIMAGIGNPERFLTTLENLGLQRKNTTHHWFSDHHAFEEADIPANGAVVMTEKDAVKCQTLLPTNTDVWYLPVSLQLPISFQKTFLEKLNQIKTDYSNE